MSRYELTRWSGLAGLVSGLLIITGAVSTAFVEPAVSGTLFVSGHILLFFLLTGVYGITHAYTGIIGLSGYVLSIIGNALFVAIQLIHSFVISGIENTWVLGAMDLVSPIIPAAIPVTGLVFTTGLLLFAIANTRVRALSTWPGWLMFAGMALNILLPRVLSDAPDQVLAIPPIMLGLGVAGFGWGLRRD